MRSENGQFTTNQATFAVVPVAEALFKVMVALPVEVFGTALATQTPASAFCSTASTREAVVRPPGTATVADAAGDLMETLPERLNLALPLTLSAVPPPVATTAAAVPKAVEAFNPVPF